jgi:hypothetical protein
MRTAKSLQRSLRDIFVFLPAEIDPNAKFVANKHELSILFSGQSLFCIWLIPRFLKNELLFEGSFSANELLLRIQTCIAKSKRLKGFFSDSALIIATDTDDYSIECSKTDVSPSILPMPLVFSSPITGEVLDHLDWLSNLPILRFYFALIYGQLIVFGRWSSGEDIYEAGFCTFCADYGFDYYACVESSEVKKIINIVSHRRLCKKLSICGFENGVGFRFDDLIFGAKDIPIKDSLSELRVNFQNFLSAETKATFRIPPDFLPRPKKKAYIISQDEVCTLNIGDEKYLGVSRGLQFEGTIDLKCLEIVRPNKFFEVMILPPNSWCLLCKDCYILKLHKDIDLAYNENLQIDFVIS